MAASLRGREPRRRGIYAMLSSNAVRTVTGNISSVWQRFVKSSHEFYVKVSNKSDYEFKPRLSSLDYVTI
jgi:hypothetical protein